MAHKQYSGQLGKHYMLISAFWSLLQPLFDFYMKYQTNLVK
jgi:hypothetical protein